VAELEDHVGAQNAELCTYERAVDEITGVDLTGRGSAEERTAALLEHVTHEGKVASQLADHVRDLEAENERLRAALGPPAVRLVQSCQDCSGGFCKRCRDDIQAAIQAALEGK
jgi:hypothetical protein